MDVQRLGADERRTYLEEVVIIASFSHGESFADGTVYARNCMVVGIQIAMDGIL